MLLGAVIGCSRYSPHGPLSKLNFEHWVALFQIRRLLRKIQTQQYASVGRKEEEESYAIYIRKVLKELHPHSGVSSKAMDILNSFANDMFERIASEAGSSSAYSGTKTLTSREIRAACCLILPGELGRHAVSQATMTLSRRERHFRLYCYPRASTEGRARSAKRSNQVEYQPEANRGRCR